MIDSVGYTEDGNVWLNVLFKYNDEPIKMVVTMSQQQANEVSAALITAAKEAAKFQTDLIGSNGGAAHVRNSKNID